MTISTQTRTAGPFTTNGSTTAFPFAFKCFAASDIVVVRRVTATGVESNLVLNTDYTVSLNANQDANPGGTVNTVGALGAGFTLTLTTNLQYLQPTDLTNQGGFYPKVITTALDRLTIFSQQVFGLATRALKFPISDGNLDATIPGKDQRKGRVLAFHETTGLPVAGPTIADTGTVGSSIAAIKTVADNIADVNTVADYADEVANFNATYQGPKATDPTLRNDGTALQQGDLYFNTNSKRLRVYTGSRWSEANTGSVSVQTFTGNGATTSFQLNTAPDNENVVQVFVGGVYQSKTVYDLTGANGDMLTFVSAPPNGVSIEAVTFSVLPLGVVDASQVQMAGGLTLAGVAERWIMPEDFGAVGDGVADDAAAILAARDHAVVTGNLLALGKMYATSQEIDLSSLSVVYAHNTTIVPLMDTTAEAVIKYKGAQGGTLEDRQLLGALTVVWPDADWSKQRTSFFFRNCYAGEFHIGSKRATRAVYAQGWDSGTVHCDFHIKQMWQNCVGVWLGSVNSNGWCNSNRFHGGFFFGSKSVTGALYAAQAGHIYLESTPYQVNGNVFLYPSIEWVGIAGPDFLLARMGGTRNKLFIGYCEYNDAATGTARPTRWMLDIGLKNMIDATCVPYAIGYDPSVSGVNNRIDASGAQEPFIRGTQGYVDASGEGTQNYVSNSSTRATMALRNAGGGPALVLHGGVKTEGFTPMAGSATQTISRFEDVSFTPSVIGTSLAGSASYDKRAATVQRVNDSVDFTYSLKWTGHTGSGDFAVTLPVASAASPSDFSSLVDCLWTGFSIGANKVLKGLVIPSQSRITFYAMSTDTGALSLITLPTSGEVYLSGRYKV